METLDENMGFWVRTNDEIELSVQGDELSGGSIPLPTGWNLIGCPATIDSSIADAFAGVAGDLTIVWMYNSTDSSDHWKMYDPSVPSEVNDLLTYTKGYGYWVRVSDDATLVVN